MSEEEKKAIEHFQDDINYLENDLKHPNFLGKFITFKDKELQMLKTVLNLIEKQQEQLQEKDKIIELMAQYIACCDTDEDICKKWKPNNNCEDDGVSCKECLIEYFTKKAREV